MTKIETPSPETICRTIVNAIVNADVPVRAATALAILFPEAPEMNVTKRTPYTRAVDRGLQAARKGKFATYDSKKGWRLTKAGRALCA